MGAHPVEAVQTMASIAATTEEDIDYKVRFSNVYPAPLTKNITSAIGHATVTTAHDLGAAAIVTVTQSGTTARMISKYRPDVPIIGATTEEKVLHQLMLSWGVVPVRCVRQDNTDALFDHAVEVGRTTGLIHPDDIVVITAGIPLGASGTTNMLKVQTVR